MRRPGPEPGPPPQECDGSRITSGTARRTHPGTASRTRPASLPKTVRQALAFRKIALLAATMATAFVRFFAPSRVMALRM